MTVAAEWNALDVSLTGSTWVNLGGVVSVENANPNLENKNMMSSVFSFTLHTDVDLQVRGKAGGVLTIAAGEKLDFPTANLFDFEVNPASSSTLHVEVYSE